MMTQTLVTTIDRIDDYSHTVRQHAVAIHKYVTGEGTWADLTEASARLAIARTAMYRQLEDALEEPKPQEPWGTWEELDFVADDPGF